MYNISELRSPSIIFTKIKSFKKIVYREKISQATSHTHVLMLPMKDTAEKLINLDIAFGYFFFKNRIAESLTGTENFWSNTWNRIVDISGV